MNEINERFSLLLESLRKMGIKQFDVANRLGVTETAVSAWKSGRRNISESLIKSICREFDVNTDYLLYGIGEMFMERIDEDETAALVSNLLGNDNPFYDTILSTMRMYDKLNQNSQRVVDDFFKSIAEDMSNKKES